MDRVSGSIDFDKKKKLKSSYRFNIFLQRRPEVLEADVVRFQNNREKWIAFID